MSANYGVGLYATAGAEKITGDIVRSVENFANEVIQQTGMKNALFKQYEPKARLIGNGAIIAIHLAAYYAEDFDEMDEFSISDVKNLQTLVSRFSSAYPTLTFKSQRGEFY